jgi:hypothetical protein
MNVWVPILLLLILAEVWWFGAHDQDDGRGDKQ